MVVRAGLAMEGSVLRLAVRRGDDARMPRMRPLLSRAPDRWLQRRAQPLIDLPLLSLKFLVEGHHRRWGRRRASTTVSLSSRDSSDATSPPRRLLTELLTKEDLVAYIASGYEIATPGTETMLGFSDHVRSFVNPVWTSSLSGNYSNTTSRTGKQLDISHEKVRENYDIMQQPENISTFSKDIVCFFMFLDEETEAAIKKITTVDNMKRIRLWRIDGKLKLVKDPYQLLKRFLWRKNVRFTISRYYRRFDVFEEAEANKAGNVLEGCVIIGEPIPITNLFTRLWFNEVDRPTSRDQLSFSTTRDKIRSRVLFDN
ncbi:hypothetical protein VPH35_139427 [Triticum aestivum]